MSNKFLTAFVALTSVATCSFALAAKSDSAASTVRSAEATTHSATVFIEQYDTNGDGKVDAAEFAAFRGKRYAETDQDNNAAIDVDEYVAEYAARHDKELDSARKAQVEQAHTRFKAMEKNGDGFISREEFNASGARAFEHLDTDRDGRISAADPEPKREQKNTSATEKDQPKPRRQVLNMPSTHTRAGTLEIYDADADGVVTREEFDRVRGESFTLTDVNGDGRIDAEEYLLEFEDRLDRRISKTRDSASKQSVIRFKAIDTDEDGRISAEEYAASGKRMFERMDTNKDGQVSVDDPAPEPRADKR